MWNYSNDFNKWFRYKDELTLSNYEFYKQELQSVRFYSKCLSGATFLPVIDTNDIYDILGEYETRNWYISIQGSSFSNTLIPSQGAKEITSDTSYEFYTKFIAEYGLTLKNHFTPNRIIKDSVKNFVEIDLATTTSIDLTLNPMTIDGVELVNGHKVLVKNQVTNLTLLNTENPEDFIPGNFTIIEQLGATIEYQYFDETNGLYEFDGNLLVKMNDLDDYGNCVRLSFVIKEGLTNREKQFHLVRLRNGYFPTSSLFEPMEFVEKKNWLLRNRVDYNNLFEINYYDVKKFATQSYYLDGVTYSIPMRTIAVGEFGMILNTQFGVSNIISNRYKVNLRSIDETEKYYWIVGDDGILLKVRKHDFLIERIEVDCKCPRNLVTTDLYSVSFYDELNGVAAGELNTVLVTKDGGNKWERLRISDFDAFTYTQCLYYSQNSFFVAGYNGIFLEFTQDINGWRAVRRRISRFIDDDDEYVLVDNINSIFRTEVTSWGLSYSFSTQSTSSPKDLLFLVADDSKIIVYDINNSIDSQTFLYLDFPNPYGDIKNIIRREGTDNFYFSGTDPITNQESIYSFDIKDHKYIGVGNSFSNTVIGITPSTIVSAISPNRLFDYQGEELFVCGNTSLLLSSSYSTINLQVLDSTFESKLKPKMLFLDYDIGAKLAFFTDFGEYRLPNSITFSSASFSSTTTLSFSPISYTASSPDFITKTETNWFTYWQDRSKTFEYYSNMPLDESSKIVISPTFSYTGLTTSYTITSIDTSTSSIGNLAPSIIYGTGSNSLYVGVSSRFNGAGLTPITAPTQSYDLYLHDYMIIAKFPVGYYSVEVGDTLYLQSQVVDSKLIVNKILTFGSNQYVYMFNDFNGQMINDLQLSTYSITLTNLNKFANSDELELRFKEHPLSIGYQLEKTSTGEVKIDAVFNNYTAYYNMGTKVELSGDYRTMSYTSGFLNFGYTPTYNLLDYLEKINDDASVNPLFSADKEFYAMPEYLAIPMPGNQNFETTQVYIDYNGLTYSQSFATPGNQIIFGIDRKLEWESLFINTFVDITIHTSVNYGQVTYLTERALITKKYFDSRNSWYVIELHKKLNFPLNQYLYWIDIKSRRSLKQISDDLQELNNIQRARLQTKEVFPGSTFSSYESELKVKFFTDSYAKVLLSDSNVVRNLTSIIYTDYKNELSMNITNLGKDFNIPILNTSNQLGKLLISCGQKHELRTGEGVVLEFTGGTGSSQELNQQYFGYFPVTITSDYNFTIDISYGTTPIVGNDLGFVRYSRRDPFLNYQPVDIIDLGVDKRGKQSVELKIENVKIEENKFILTNVDFSKFRYRLVDGLNIETLSERYPWILEAEISDAIIGESNNLIWYKGTWECGRWFGGEWISGSWVSGDWYGGTWNSLTIKDKKISVEIDNKSSNPNSSTWFGGRWYDGTWNNGLWVNGRWYGGTWNEGIWYNGIWNRGTWNNGRFTGGVWILGNWNNGIFNCDNNPAYWLDGEWSGGDFENGMWYNGLFRQVFNSNNTIRSRFGTKSYNSRTATWHGGKWNGGSFYSSINLNDDDQEDVSEVHKYSIWYTGQWLAGSWYGGIAYNIDMKSGTWYGGILDDIQIIGMNSTNNYFVLNGIFKFNIGDEFTVLDNRLSSSLGVSYGNNFSQRRYTVLYTVEDSVNKWTYVYVATNITDDITEPTYTGLWVVSRFKNANWKSGIWTNGVYESGLWEGGIWYNGVFEGTWM
jgi:hypothetical protein